MMDKVSLNLIDQFLILLQGLWGAFIISIPLWWPLYLIGIATIIGLIIFAIKFNRHKHRPGE